MLAERSPRVHRGHAAAPPGGLDRRAGACRRSVAPPPPAWTRSRLSLWRPPRAALSWAGGAVRPETSLQPSPEQLALITARRADPAGSLRVLAFAGSGKTTALKLLAAADPSPALYLAYNKAAQLEAQRRFPAHLACRPIHSLAYRATGMAEQRHRLERRLAAREVAEALAVPALDGLRPSFWAHCAVGTLRAFAHSAAREIGPEHLPA